MKGYSTSSREGMETAAPGREAEMEEALAEDFHDYVTCDDYYPPVMEDYDAEYALSKCCKELGLKLVHVSSSGDMSDFEPDDMRW